MSRRSLLRLCLLAVAVTFLFLPAALADICEDGLCPASADCCPAACCSCCLHGFSVSAVSVQIDLGPASTDRVGEPPLDLVRSAPSRDVFHVPKLGLA